MNPVESMRKTASVASCSMGYRYPDLPRPDILKMIPEDGAVIGSIGCGHGGTEAALVRAGKVVHGVDVSAEAIEVARLRLTSARVIQPDDRAPFAPQSLDGLILADVIEHIPGAWDYLCAFTQCVRPGGWVVISVPNMRSLKAAAIFLIGGDWPEATTGIFDSTHVQVMTRRRLERWCHRAGLRPEKWFGRYLSEGTWKEPWLQRIDNATGRLAHDWLLGQVQVRCRVM